MRERRNKALQEIVNKKKIDRGNILSCITPISLGSVVYKDMESQTLITSLLGDFKSILGGETIDALKMNIYDTTVDSSIVLDRVVEHGKHVSDLITRDKSVENLSAKTLDVGNESIIAEFLGEIWEWAKDVPEAFLDGIGEGFGLWMDSKILAFTDFLLEYGMQCFEISFVCYCAYIAFKMMFNIGDVRTKNYLYVWLVVLVITKLLFKLVLIPA